MNETVNKIDISAEISHYKYCDKRLNYNKDSFWQDKNILITGSTGFVGSWITKKLVQKGANVVSIVRDLHRRSSLELVCGKDYLPASMVIGDICDYEFVSRVLVEYNIQVVMHLAAQAIVPVANKSPLSTFHSNIEGTWNILEGCRNASTVASIVIASSDKSYGEPTKVPITEDHPLLAAHPYDASKACAEILSRSYAKSYGLPVAISRCSNIYGGGDLNFSRIIPDTIRSVLAGNDPIIRSDGRPVRDFSYIDDIVNGYLILSQALALDKSLRGEAFNFGTNTPTTILDLVSKIILVAGKKDLKPKVLNNSTNEIQVQYLDSTKSRERLGWSSSVNLIDGLTKTVAWYAEYFGKGAARK